MKKILSIVTVLTMFIAVLILPTQAAAKTLFSDNFSSADLAAKWINPAIDNDPETVDKECEGVATVKDGTLYLENNKRFGSFFYMGAKDLQLQDFTLTMKVKPNLFNTGWLGVSFRKDANDRFNGCNNNFITLDFGKKNTTGNVIYSQAYRGYSGSSPATITNKTDVDSKTPKFYQGNTSEWLTWRIEVKGTSFKSYLNGQLLGDWEYKKNQTTGYISVNCCIFDGYIDDVTITEYEALPAPSVNSSLNATESKSPVTNTSKPPVNTTSSQSVASSNSGVINTESSSEVSEPNSSKTESETKTTETGALLKPKYKDVTVDNTFKTITLENALNVKDMLDSFTIAEGYTIRLVDADGNAVEDQEAVVTDTMKLQVLQDSGTTAEYTLNINAKDAINDNTGFPGWAIALIIIGGTILIAAVVLLILVKKGVIKVGSKK
ncbi:MAG: DUF1080 domain-containing protein [Clostridiales bacterium]|nr:DUF1080 domain-containing protein [Clostridiales bacterium]